MDKFDQYFFTQSVGSKSTAALNNKDNNNLVVLPGYYHVWQEVISRTLYSSVLALVLFSSRYVQFYVMSILCVLRYSRT